MIKEIFNLKGEYMLITVITIIASLVLGVILYLYFDNVQMKQTNEGLVASNVTLTQRLVSETVNSATFKAQVDKQNAIYSRLSIEYDKKVMDFERWKHDNREKTIKEDIPSLEGESDECEDILFAIDNLRTNGM